MDNENEPACDYRLGRREEGAVRFALAYLTKCVEAHAEIDFGVLVDTLDLCRVEGDAPYVNPPAGLTPHVLRRLLGRLKGGRLVVRAEAD